MPGPTPKPNSRRRNPPTIPTSVLPRAGRKGRAPAVPRSYKLKAAGRAWWNWAWKLPHATKWDAGARYFVARRAQLEDDLVSLEDADRFSLDDYMAVSEEDRDVAQRLETLIRRLKALAGSRIGVMKEMRELDNRLGLNPKAMADLRWTVGDEEPKKASKKSRAEVTRLADYRKRLG